MSSSLRMDNHLFYNEAGVTVSENSNAVEVGGARGYAIVLDITDNGSGAGTVALEASLDGTTYVTIGGTSTAIVFTGILFTVIDPMYKHVRVATTISAGDIDIAGTITVIEGAS